MNDAYSTRETGWADITWNVGPARYCGPLAGNNRHGACAPYGRDMSTKRLFAGPTHRQFVQVAEESARRMIMNLTEDELRANSLEDLAQAVVADKVPKPLTLDIEHHEIGSEIVSSTSHRVDGYADIYQPADPFPEREVIQGSLHIRYTGTRQAFDFRPNRTLASVVEAAISNGEVVLTVIVNPNTSSAEIEQRLLLQEQHLAAWVMEVNRDIALLERDIRALATRQVQERLAVIRKRDDMRAAFTITVRDVEPARALDVPVNPTAVVLKAAPEPGASGDREWRLDTPIYERMIQTITKFGHALERRPRSAAPLLHDEETIRDWLMFNLSTNYEAPDGSELFIGGEVENGNGKTDILVRHRNRNVFIAECKFWHGPQKFDEAIQQLLGYTTWRDTKAAIILFITNKNASAAIDSAGARLTAHAACKEAPVPAAPYERRDYRFTHPDDSQRVISLALLPVVIRKTTPSATPGEA